jgi:hypothetical protein
MPSSANSGYGAGRGRLDGKPGPEELDVRAMAVLGVAWASFGLIAAVLFRAMVAPTIGSGFVVELTGKGGASSLDLDTNALAVVLLVGAGLAVVVCGILAVVARRATAVSVGVGALISVLTPLLVALVSVNVLSPVGADGRAVSAWVGMVIGAAVGGASVVLVAFLTRREAPAQL